MPKLLVANRGEISARIQRTAHRMGWQTVAIYSDADRNALHVRCADEAVCVGPAPAAESYLNIRAIIDAAEQVKATHIHPGYGFLSENPDFAEAVADAGLIWVGPRAQVIEQMGSKAAAKEVMKKAGVPVIPGLSEAEISIEAVSDIGTPFVIKAVAGGGGKGMRVIHDLSEFEQALPRARSEALSAFGNGDVLIEKWVTEPRHIEVQIVGDGRQTAVLGLRDCSVQRRHQKVFEEAPAPHISDELQAAFENAARKAGDAVGYEGAGTVEFVLSSTGEFFFLEMNTRLQVEHTVTEDIFNIDLVEWQLRVAQGESVDALMKLQPQGHSIQARLYAENEQGLPMPGPVGPMKLANADGERWDMGVASDDEVRPEYDPMFGKLIVTAEDRETALEVMRAALFYSDLGPAATNRHVLLNILQHPEFEAGGVSTGFYDRDNWMPERSSTIAALVYARENLTDTSWGTPGFRLGQSPSVQVKLEGESIAKVTRHNGWTVSLGGEETQFKSLGRGFVHGETLYPNVRARIEGGRIEWLGNRYGVASIDQGRASGTGEAGGEIQSPMGGAVVACFVNSGDEVTEGQPLFVVEAMKMELTVSAPRGGVVEGFTVAQGDVVRAKTALGQILESAS